ncbi:hypothetical protein L596_018512 [Steinernema carpocapsae]|nr:hypothetical protein L596_018512 [Steinernema carpocapsae]
MADSRRIVRPTPLTTPLPQEKRPRGRPRGSRNTPREPIFRQPRPPPAANGDMQILDPNAISLHDIGPVVTPQEDGTRPSTSAPVVQRTKEFDYRRKVQDRLGVMMQNDHSKIMCLLPEVENTTTSQMSIFIRRLRTQFYPEGSKKSSSEIPQKPRMPSTISEPLYGSMCEDMDSFKKCSSSAILRSPRTISENGKDWQFDPDLTESSGDSSGDEFTDDEVTKPPTKKRRFISHTCSEFKYYEMMRKVSEAKDMVKQAKDDKQRHLDKLRAILEKMEAAREPYEFEEPESGRDSCARMRAVKNKPNRDLSKMIMVPREETVPANDIEHEWHVNVGERLALPEDYGVPMAQLIQNSRRAAYNNVDSFEARRRGRKLVRAAMVARRLGQHIPSEYVLLRRQEELWKTRKRVVKRRPKVRPVVMSTAPAPVKRKAPTRIVESEEEVFSDDSDYEYEEGQSKKSRTGKTRGRPPKGAAWSSLNGSRRSSNAGKSKSKSKRQPALYRESEYEFDDQIMDTTIKQVDYKEIDVPTWKRIDSDPAYYEEIPKEECNMCTTEHPEEILPMKLVELHQELELNEKRRCYGLKQSRKSSAARDNDVKSRSISGSPVHAEGNSHSSATTASSYTSTVDRNVAYEQCRSQIEGTYVPNYDRPSNAAPYPPRQFARNARDFKQHN